MVDGEEREREAMLAVALAALRRRERTVVEMRKWLNERATAEGIVEEVIAELVAVGELDDERFARSFAADKRELSGWGPERIEATLLERGLERELAESAGDEGREEQLDRAAGMLARRSTALEEEGERARALAFLIRRGFDYELAYDAIRKAEREPRAAA